MTLTFLLQNLIKIGINVILSIEITLYICRLVIKIWRMFYVFGW